MQFDDSDANPMKGNSKQARKNSKRSPWRSRPMVNSPENQKRVKRWREGG